MTAPAPLLVQCVSAADVVAQLRCSRAAAYRHLRAAALRMGRAPEHRGLLRVPLEVTPVQQQEWDAWTGKTGGTGERPALAVVTEDSRVPGDGIEPPTRGFSILREESESARMDAEKRDCDAGGVTPVARKRRG